MSFLGSWKIDDLLTFYANTTRFDTGAATDADAVPAYRVYEDETGTAILTGNMALLDSANTAGFYSEQITLSAANGFEKGKSYAIYIAATVNSVAGATHHTLQIEAEVDANRINWANIDNPTTAQNLSATNIDVDQVVASVTGAVGSVAAGGITAASIATDAIDADAIAANAVTEIQSGLATSANQTTIINTLGTPAGVSISADIAAIEAQTDDIGVAGAGLTAIPWNAAWDAEVQSEVQDAIEANNLDHLVGTATGIPAIPAGTYIDQMMDDGTAVFDRTTDSLQAIRDRGDAAWITATGFSTLTQADVRTAVGLAAANLDTQLTTIDDFLDTEVAAIKAKTDQLTFTVANQVDANTIALSGDTVAADNAEAFFDGTGYAGTNNVIPTVTTTVNLTTNNDKTGYALSAAGVDAILDDAITEPAGVFAWGTATLRNIIGWLGALSSNEIRQTAALQTLRNRADSVTIATAAVADDGVTATRDSFT